MKKWIKRIVIVLVVLVVLSVSGMSIFTGYMVAEGLVFGIKDKETHEASIGQLETWSYDWEAFESTYEVTEMKISGNDENKIPLYLLGSDTLEDKNTVILVHGYGGDYLSVFPQAEMYINNGYNVLAIDQRGSGQSIDKKVTFGYYEKEDIKSVVDYVNEQVDSEYKVIVHGFSMGAATVGLYSGTEHAEANVDGCVMDSSFDSMESMLLGMWDNFETGLPGEYGVFCGNIALKLRFGFGFNDTQVNDALEVCETPMLLIHSMNDTIVSDQMSEELYSSIKSDQKVYFEMDTEHIKGCIDYPEDYEIQVMEFIDAIGIKSN